MNKKDIFIIHGTNYKEMTLQLLEAADLAAAIGSTKKHIGLKPNLICAKDPSLGATTHGELTAGTIEYLQKHGFSHITVMESSWVGERTSRSFHAFGYDRICDAYGIPFVDLQKDSYHTYDAKGMQINVCDAAMNVDFMINLPVLKGHCQTTITCALKNNKGVIPNSEKRRFHTLGLHKPIAHLNTVARNDFILVDNICGDLDFEEGGNPVTMNRILGFWDPVLCDAYVCDSMGHSVDEVPYITMAERLGVGCADTSKANVILLNQDTFTDSRPRFTRRVEALAGYTAPKDACSACYGSLIYALDRLRQAGKLKKNASPVSIGQGWKNCPGKIGIGNCTSCCSDFLKGCPPKAVDILRFLEENWES
ncbi:DUF362 domain-containing protein [Candidatus Merdisoma sp. JLR.KK006]|jgi:uncharacterized protein (DUF362 family)|uniref:DUF362 domain-containing protein n=1 Tax=Candidatus Merdisoma sp. JLR.KK006 TaxID=3112626 RepID=UPI002FF372BC